MNWQLAAWWMAHRHNMPQGLRMLRFEVFPKKGEAIYLEFEGAEFVPEFKSGPRKGKPNYSKATGRHVTQVLVSDIPMIESTYEGVTGRCVRCMGEGKQWDGWAVKDGSKFRPCKRCNATGLAPQCTATSAT